MAAYLSSIRASRVRSVVFYIAPYTFYRRSKVMLSDLKLPKIN